MSLGKAFEGGGERQLWETMAAHMLSSLAPNESPTQVPYAHPPRQYPTFPSPWRYRHVNAFAQRPVRRSHCPECGAVVWLSILADVGPKCPKM